MGCSHLVQLEEGAGFVQQIRPVDEWGVHHDLERLHLLLGPVGNFLLQMCNKVDHRHTCHHLDLQPALASCCQTCMNQALKYYDWNVPNPIQTFVPPKPVCHDDRLRPIFSIDPLEIYIGRQEGVSLPKGL